MKEKIKKWLKRYYQIIMETSEERDFRIVSEYEEKREKIGQWKEWFRLSLIILGVSFILQVSGIYRLSWTGMNLSPSNPLIPKLSSWGIFWGVWGFFSLFAAIWLEYNRAEYFFRKKRRNRRLEYYD